MFVVSDLFAFLVLSLKYMCEQIFLWIELFNGGKYKHMLFQWSVGGDVF